MTFHGSSRRSGRQPEAAALQTYPVTVRLYSWWTGGGCRRDPSMGQDQPLRQKARGFVGGLAVKRHHGGRHAGTTAQLGTPPVGYVHDLDLVRAPANSLFETMNRHVCDVRGGVKDERRFYASLTRDQAKGETKRASTGQSREDRALGGPKNISVSGCPQDLHLSCTGFQQLQLSKPECLHR